jgi:hypothetical protein
MNIAIFEGISSLRCFYTTQSSRFGTIDLQTKGVIWEIDSGSKVVGVFEAGEAIITLEFVAGSSVYTRRSALDGALIWQAKVDGILNSVNADDGAFFGNYFITGGITSNGGQWSSQTLVINIENGKIALLMTRQGNLASAAAISCDGLAFVHTARGVAVLAAT